MAASELRKRLAQFDRESSRPTRQRDEARPGGVALEELFARGAQWVGSAPSGYLRLELPVDSSLWPAAPQRAVPAEAWRRMTRDPLPQAGDWAVLDTETTGLESGTGNLVFLVGLLRWGEEGARLVQFFLPEPQGERRLLEDLWAELATVRALVSYNGRGFDCARLRTRAVLARLSADALTLPHLDLIHPARRVGRDWLPDCRLGTVEQRILGRERHDDLPSAEVPDIYRDYLLEGVDRGLGRVLDHNRWDVENLMALAATLAACFGDGADPFPLPGPAQLGLGRALEKLGLIDGALHRYRSALDDDALEPELARRALWAAAHAHRRRSEFKRAEALFEESIRRWPAWIAPRVEMAKILEHRRHDHLAALSVVEDALRVVEHGSELLGRGHGLRLQRDALMHRRRRLDRRAAVRRSGRMKGSQA